MKRLALCLILGIVCMGMVSYAEAQEKAGKGKSSSKTLPSEVCKAIEQYVAKIDAARAVKDPATRSGMYFEAAAALQDPASMLKGPDKDNVLSIAANYAGYTEMVVSGDAKDAHLDTVLEKRLNARTELLEMCSSYTSTR
jgi:hypothetical protein